MTHPKTKPLKTEIYEEFNKLVFKYWLDKTKKPKMIIGISKTTFGMLNCFEDNVSEEVLIGLIDLSQKKAKEIMKLGGLSGDNTPEPL